MSTQSFYQFMFLINFCFEFSCLATVEMEKNLPILIVQSIPKYYAVFSGS